MPRKRTTRAAGPPRKAAPPEPSSTALDHDVKTRIDAELHRLVQEAATREDRSEAAIVRRALRAYLDARLPEVTT